MADQKTLKLVNEAKNMIGDGRMKVADLDLPRNKKYKDALEQYYGTTLQLITSDDTGSLLNLFSRAIKDGMTETGFSNALKQTNWYLKYDESNRTYQAKINDPAAQQDLATRRSDIIEAVQNQALTDTGNRMDDATAAAVAEDLLKNNYNNWSTKVASRVRSSLSKMDVTKFGGQVLNTTTAIRDYARKMGMAISDERVNNYVKDILSNTITVDAVQAQLRNDVLPYYPQFADRIKAGDTIDDITSPYRNMIASMLEIDPNNVGFDITGSKMDPILLKALSGDGGKPAGLYDVRKMIKQDSRWQYTRNAAEEYASLTTKLMRMFGAGV